MGEVSEPRPVNLICGVLAGREEWLAAARTRLEREFGEIDCASEVWPFGYTGYYEREMGAGLLRVLYGFRDLQPPDALAEAKLTTNRIEAELAEALQADVARPVNLDPGYVTAAKLVLATTKDQAHRVCIGRGIYAECTLRWRDGAWAPWEWTYPDYRSERYGAFFRRVRDGYCRKMKG